MDTFPRTTVGGLSLSRLIIGTNWFLGYSHTSRAKDLFIVDLQTPERMADIICTFLEYGVDTIMGPPSEPLRDAIQIAQDRTGKELIVILTPHFNILPGGPEEMEPERQMDYCKQLGAHFLLPHQAVTDRLLDRMHRTVRDMDRYSAMIRERGMIPGLASHTPETIVIADECGVDSETYIQLYNAIGFLMQVEVDWIMRVIHKAKNPVMTIKPLAAGRMLPPVGLAFVWNTLRDIDMVTIGTTTPAEARESTELSLDYLSRRLPEHELQVTRSKKVLTDAAG